ncbi:MAG: 30S ribosomal protein S8 [Candidatus Omnitrophica bacterium]|nr:30S ribosomal protein S8 [Candidatus Omnitrophota bacterium]
MPITDSIADMLTVVRNGVRAKKEKIDVRNSKFSQKILDILKSEGYIKNFKVIEDKKQGMIRVYLKYKAGDKSSFITQIKRISKPGLRVYVEKGEAPKVLNGLGTAVMSTSKGVMTSKEAKKNKIGGEVICYIW